MDGDHAKGQVFNAATAESRHFHAVNQFLLFGEFPDGFHEVLVAVPVLGDDFAHFRNQAIGVFIVNFGEERLVHF